MSSKRSLTLLEVTISLVLAGILIGAVLNSYRQITLSQAKVEKAKSEVLSHKLIEQRLITIFSNFKDKEEKDKKNESFTSLFTQLQPESKGSALILEYDQGIDPDPTFCNQVKSELYLTQKNQLALKTYSLSGEPRLEILKEGISELKFHFFDPKKGLFVTLWEKDQKKLPAMVKMVISSPNPIEFVFFIPLGEEEIIYKGGVT